MKVFAGCDGGGTKCVARAVVCDHDGQIVQQGEGVAGPANVRSDPALAQQNILLAMNMALAAANVQLGDKAERMVAGLAGAGDAPTQQHWQEWLSQQLPFRRVDVLPDVEILFAAAECMDEPAVATVIGTGSIAWARDRDGKITRAGGRGPRSGDLGSAYWMGCRAIEASNESSELGEPLREHFRAGDLDKLTEQLHAGKLEVAAVASFAPMLFQLKLAPAEAIVSAAAVHVAELLVQAIRAIATANPLSWICAGGVAVHQPAWLETIQRHCEERQLLLRQPMIIKDPVAGAIRLATARPFPPSLGSRGASRQDNAQL